MSKGLDALKRYRDIPTTMDYDIVKRELEEYQEVKTYMQQYEISDIEELRRVLHNDWVIRQKFKTDTANVAKALEIVKELFGFDFAIRFPTNRPMLRITNKRTNEYWEMLISKEIQDLLKEVLL